MFLSKKIKDIQTRKQFSQKEYSFKLNKVIQQEYNNIQIKNKPIFNTKNKKIVMK